MCCQSMVQVRSVIENAPTSFGRSGPCASMRSGRRGCKAVRCSGARSDAQRSGATRAPRVAPCLFSEKMTTSWVRSSPAWTGGPVGCFWNWGFLAPTAAVLVICTGRVFSTFLHLLYGWHPLKCPITSMGAKLGPLHGVAWGFWGRGTSGPSVAAS